MLRLYIASWIATTLVALYFIVRNQGTERLFTKKYWEFLSQPWKIWSFLVAAVTLAALSRYANDPTWDIPDSTMMSVLTFLTAPWAVGVIYRALSGMERDKKEIFVALCVWLFSASWSYDAYVWLYLLGVYPFSWSGNLMISPILYLLWGMFWNLESRNGKAVFAFREKEWIENTVFPIGNSIFAGMLFVSVIAVIFWWFVIMNR